MLGPEMEVEKGWPKIWEDVQKAGVLSGVDAAAYVQRYAENTRSNVRPFLSTLPSGILSAERIAEVHRRQFDQLTPWAGQWAKQATIGEFRGSPEHRTPLELRLLEDQTRRLLKQIDPADLNHVARVAAFLHARFEAIHPFPDGNGRVGRLLLTHFVRYTTAKAGLARGGIVKGNHPDKFAYVEALIEARKTNNLAPLARHFQFELTGKAEDLSYLPSPFQIAPKSLPVEAYGREFRDSVRDPVEAIATPGLPERRPWLIDATLEPLRGFVPAEATAGRSFQAVRKLLTENRLRMLSLGEAVAVIGKLRELKPYSLGLLGRDVGAEPFQRWAQGRIFEPFLRTLDVPSQAKLRVAIRAQLAGEEQNSHLATDAIFSTSRCAGFIAPTADYDWALRTTPKSRADTRASSRQSSRGKGKSEGAER